MNILKEFPTEYLTAADIAAASQAGKTARLTIKAVVKETARNPRTGKDGEVPVVSFAGTAKKLRMNRSSINQCVHAWGAETDNWVGKDMEFSLIQTSLPDAITKERKLGILAKPAKDVAQ